MNPSPSWDKTPQKAFGSLRPQREASFSFYAYLVTLQELLPRSLPKLHTLNSNGEYCPFCDPGSSSLLTANAASNPQGRLKSWTRELNSKAAASQRHSCTEVPALLLGLHRISDKLLSQKDFLFKLCEDTSRKLWKPCNGFISPSPLLTRAAAL